MTADEMLKIPKRRENAAIIAADQALKVAILEARANFLARLFASFISRKCCSWSGSSALVDFGALL